MTTVTWWLAPSDLRNSIRDQILSTVAELECSTAGRARWAAVLMEIATRLEFVGAALWLPDQGNALRCELFVASVEMDLFERQTRTLTLASGVGMPGRTWLHAVPEWIPNVVKDDNFPRLRGAIRDLVRAVAAFPVVADDQIIGVVEMYSRQILHPDSETTQLLSDLGRLMGRCHSALLHLDGQDA